MKNIIVVTLLSAVACGCGMSAGTVPASGQKPVVKVLPSGSAILPGGVPLPPEAVKAGAANMGKK